MSPAASTRWCPTPEQVMILEEMYRSGVRTPNAAQIQQITAHLSLYGKIEGKNVFYWFQNHKARDRQKLRKKLLGKQLQQHQQQIMFSHHIFPTFDPHHHHQQQFQHYPNHHNNNNNNNNNSLLHHLHFDQPPPPALPLPPPPPCCGPTSSSSLGLFHHQLPSVNPSTYFGAHQTRAEEAVPQMANSCTWKMETTSEAKYARDNKKKPMMRMFTNNDHHDDWMMMMRSRDHHHHDNDDNHDYYYHDDENSSTKPIKTLELFPIKDKTSLKKDLSYV